MTCSNQWHVLFEGSVSCAIQTRCNMEHNRVEKIRDFDRPSGQTSVHMPTIQKIAHEKHNVKANQTSTTSDEFCEFLRSLG